MYRGGSRNGGEGSGGPGGSTENEVVTISIEGFEVISLQGPRKKS